jgi:hypothetical protein
MSAKQFDTYELDMVGRFESGFEVLSDLYGSTDSVTCARLYAEEGAGLDLQPLWSIYGHVAGEGVICIGDFGSKSGALEVLGLILGIDLSELTNNGSTSETIPRVQP